MTATTSLVRTQSDGTFQIVNGDIRKNLVIKMSNKMKLVGFIKEHDSVKEAVYFSSLLNASASGGDENELNKICDYLVNSGVLVFGWMGYANDLRNGELIAPLAYFTDGIWVWPSYFVHYLRTLPTYPIDEEFLQFLRRNNFRTDLILTEAERDAIEEELAKRF